MCHRTHTSASGITGTDRNGTTFTALTVGTFSGDAGDTELCYTCHGVGSLGSSIDVQAQFLDGAGHSVAPTASTYGPSPKQCSDCHDSHGSERDASGTPPAALLRSRTTTSAVYAGNGYCATCHTDRPADQFDGLAIFELTGHADITPTASGTSIVCSVCHAPHGSANRPLIVSALETPSAPSTFAVPANDRRLCAGCHPQASSTYPGYIAFQSGGHASSAATVPAIGEWVSRLPTGSAETSRKAGECQNCHNPMGSKSASSAAYPKLTRATGVGACAPCHTAGSTISTDVASLVATPNGSILEMVSSFGLSTSTAQFGRVQLFTRESTATTSVVGPRQYLGGAVGPTVVGDIDGDGRTDVVVARSDQSTVTVLTQSVLRGIEPIPGDRALLSSVTAMAIGDVLDDAGNLPELVVGSGTSVRLYRWNGTAFGTVVGGSVSVTGTITGIATGQISGTDRHEVVVTEDLPGVGADEVTVLTGTSGSLAVSAVWPTANGALPVGPTVADLSGDGLCEVVVANSGVANDIVTVFTPSGVASSTGAAGGAERARSTAVADFLFGTAAPGRAPVEVVVTVSNPTGASRVDVYPQTATGDLAAPVSSAFAQFTTASGVASGDMTGDGRVDLAVAGSGSFSQQIAPRTWLLQPNAAGTGFGEVTTHLAAGVESADTKAGSAWVAIAELGPVGASRHPVGAVPAAHVSTESAAFTPRHVECADCHNPHRSTAVDASAPVAYGPIAGTWGVSVANTPVGLITYTEKRGIDYEFELCFKCHGVWSASGTTRDIASEFDTRLASFHPVETSSTPSQATAGSFVSGWSNTSRVYCKSCHGRSGSTGARGSHASTSSPLLRRPFRGAAASDSSLLCYTCHRYDVYYTGAADGVPASTSNFHDSTLPGTERDKLHAWHAQAKGLGCDSCHVSHGATRQHMIRGDIGWVHGASGGTCVVGCHSPSKAYTSTYTTNL